MPHSSKAIFQIGNVDIFITTSGRLAVEYRHRLFIHRIDAGQVDLTRQPIFQMNLRSQSCNNDYYYFLKEELNDNEMGLKAEFSPGQREANLLHGDAGNVSSLCPINLGQIFREACWQLLTQGIYNFHVDKLHTHYLEFIQAMFKDSQVQPEEVLAFQAFHHLVMQRREVLQQVAVQAVEVVQPATWNFAATPASAEAAPFTQTQMTLPLGTPIQYAISPIPFGVSAQPEQQASAAFPVFSSPSAQPITPVPFTFFSQPAFQFEQSAAFLVPQDTQMQEAPATAAPDVADVKMTTHTKKKGNKNRAVPYRRSEPDWSAQPAQTVTNLFAPPTFAPATFTFGSPAANDSSLLAANSAALFSVPLAQRLATDAQVADMLNNGI